MSKQLRAEKRTIKEPKSNAKRKFNSDSFKSNKVACSKKSAPKSKTVFPYNLF